MKNVVSCCFYQFSKSISAHFLEPFEHPFSARAMEEHLVTESLSM